jgi:hypothetical protein
MRQLIYLVAAVFFIASCSSKKNTIKIGQNDEVAITTQDSLEYDVETFDAKFETWYQLHDNPSQYRSSEYYEGWNQRYVSAWNANAADPRKSWFFEPVVGYNYSADYGFELNHELFYYFQYVEHVLGIQIIEGGGPKAVTF